jgi:serine/threonine-protein kinase SRK2
MNVKYGFPPNLRISAECLDLIQRIFVASPQQRITIEDLKKHPWFLRNLPAELAVSAPGMAPAPAAAPAHSQTPAPAALTPHT